MQYGLDNEINLIMQTGEVESKINNLNQLAYANRYSNPQSSIAAAELAMNLSDEIDFEHGKYFAKTNLVLTEHQKWLPGIKLNPGCRYHLVIFAL